MTTSPNPCPMCGASMRRLFDARDFRRPNVPSVFRVVWCDTCRYGRLAGTLTPPEVADFYAVQYYTHERPSVSQGSQSTRASVLERIRTHLAWRVDRGIDFSPSEL